MEHGVQPNIDGARRWLDRCGILDHESRRWRPPYGTRPSGLGGVRGLSDSFKTAQQDGTHHLPRRGRAGSRNDDRALASDATTSAEGEDLEITNLPSARQAAGDQHVTVMGSASIGQQSIAAGLVRRRLQCAGSAAR
jgi:hypothetical protein